MLILNTSKLTVDFSGAYKKERGLEDSDTRRRLNARGRGKTRNNLSNKTLKECACIL